MKKINFRNIRIKKVSVNDIDDRMLLINLYVTQAFTLFIGILFIIFQKKNDFSFLFSFHRVTETWWLWGIGLGVAVLLADFIVNQLVPEHILDDGGINERIFRDRPLWHVAVICLIVSVCEELMFRGALQYWLTPYWTSILFAAIHVRYLQHWLLTGLVFSISYGLGWVYIHTGTLWSPILAHFIIDFVLGCLIHFKGGNDHEEEGDTV